MTSNDQKIIDEILRTAIRAYSRPLPNEHFRILDLAWRLRKMGLFSSKVKIRWAHIERVMDREIYRSGGTRPGSHSIP